MEIKITLKMKAGYYLELLTPETMKLLGSTKSKITKGKSLIGKYSPSMLAARQKLLDHAKISATDVLKTSSKKVIQKTEEATGDLIGNKIANRSYKSFKKFNTK